MGIELLFYPSLQCYVFKRNAYCGEDPVTPDLIRQEHLDRKSMFVGINSPVFVDIPTTSEPAAAHETLPVFKPDCVLATHRCAQHRPQPILDWNHMHVNGGPAIGSSLKYDEPEHLEQSIWLVPPLPLIPWRLMSDS